MEDNSIVPDGTILPKHKSLLIPSTWTLQDNMYYGIELDLRLKQADQCLQSLRDLIADKSFQYSHVIRVTPHQGVRTRARAVIATLNRKISHFARVYGQCRLAMTRLGADVNVFNIYCILEKQDLKVSTAILNPNEPGSTRQSLSWLWKTRCSPNPSDSETLLECEWAAIQVIHTDNP
jgi:hypothetical protein